MEAPPKCMSARSMEGEPDLPPLPAAANSGGEAGEEEVSIGRLRLMESGSLTFRPYLPRPISINPDSINISRTYNTSSSPASPPDFVRKLQAAFKRHRSLGTMMRSSGVGPIRHVGTQRETSKESNVNPQSRFDANKSKEDVLQSGRFRSLIPKSKAKVFVRGDNQEELSTTPPSEGVTTVNAHDVNIKAFDSQREQPELSTRPPMNVVASQSQVGRAPLSTRPAGEDEGQMDVVQPSYSLSKNAGRVVAHQSAVATQPTSSVVATAIEVNISSDPCKELQTSLPNDCCTVKSDIPPSDKKSESSKAEKCERGATGTTTSTSRKKGYDPDVFFKVNGKHYQRLGKIGRGGSSEVHKVISSDCTIYALKKIKLKGRGYATAYGLCQEIEYLNKLKGMNNIIQLVDYEVTDKTLLQEVMNGSRSNKESKVRDDGFIYMVLEYGEIDLAHMLAQNWKELDESNSTIDENWLRFYWQQILRAVNTIHEERIVHSDLKPANFLLVRGSLKLIDFGIAKAIMSDTTNIQRDSQVGTLSYMSPEAFMCNETDANGNTIKCGRPSDIWSLGCILYQMVYGRTPFSEYRTFWAKFKVMTDPNHEIIYEPLPNPWLLDLMKKCLAWDRNERWRIPQLLQHPFLVPPVPPKSPRPPLTMIFSQLQSMLKDPQAVMQAKSSMSKDQLCKLVIEISTAFQLQEQLGGSS